MLNLSGMVDANLGAWVINRAYDKVADSVEAVASGGSISDNTASAIIQMLLRGDIAASQEGARNASDAISMVQTFEAAASSIDQKLIQMQELATQAATGTYSDEQKAVMQAEFEDLADEINDQETIDVARRFVAKHGERVEMLERKLKAQQEELALT